LTFEVDWRTILIDVEWRQPRRRKSGQWQTTRLGDRTNRQESVRFISNSVHAAQEIIAENLGLVGGTGFFVG
jgi:hypothetical protein